MSERKIVVIPANPEKVKLYKVGIYCRVSTTSREQLYSMASQVSQLTKLVNHTPDFILVDIYMDFQSGVTEDRRELSRLLSDCHSGVIDTVVTKSVSRMARNTVDLLKIIRELRSIDIRILFENEELDSSKLSDEFMITLVESFAQAESENRSNNIRWGLEKKMQDGTSGLYKRRCFGYNKTQDGDLVICPEEAETVKLIYKLYLKGHSIIAIIRELESKGFLTPTGKEKWSKQAVVKILTNEKYTGNVMLGKSVSVIFPHKKRILNNGTDKMYFAEDMNPVIIPRAIFDTVQEERKRRSNVVSDESGQSQRAPKRYTMPKSFNDVLDTHHSGDDEWTKWLKYIHDDES